ncbi:hypothetical protein QF032_007821 [Streptomyces achromogenes]|uniref:Uncharacterized protein n=1 Tax=Streptomyces achromogenes TaxID=67255 RepID=A0ABU0QGD3_STRAH|nr:hypothetical protein [Streptomyces achromogenes]MDQ0835977.1 hypothetical protein [Streptomyces achromogenes]
MDVVLGQVGCVPGNGPVVGVIMEDSQTVMGRGGGDDEVHSGGAMLSSLSHTVLHRANPAPRVLRHRHVGVQISEPLRDLVGKSDVIEMIREIP